MGFFIADFSCEWGERALFKSVPFYYIKKSVVHTFYSEAFLKCFTISACNIYCFQHFYFVFNFFNQPSSRRHSWSTHPISFKTISCENVTWNSKLVFSNVTLIVWLVCPKKYCLGERGSQAFLLFVVVRGNVLRLDERNCW